MTHCSSSSHRSTLARGAQIALLSSAAMLLAACGSDDDTDDVTAAGSGAGGSTVPPADDAGPPAGTAPGETPVTTRATPIGDVLVADDGELTLYTFANDPDGTSTCVDGCAVDWPPLAAATEGASIDGDFDTIVRVDASLQWAFRERPLYRYAGDGAAGEVNGEGLGDVWFVARPDPIERGETALGEVLVGRGLVIADAGDTPQRIDRDGRTLYVFANDAAGISNCIGDCANAWPPLFADRGARASGEHSLIERADGSLQWAYRSRPLYFYAGDSAAGDTLGEGIGGVWSVARPAE